VIDSQLVLNQPLQDYVVKWQPRASDYVRQPKPSPKQYRLKRRHAGAKRRQRAR